MPSPLTPADRAQARELLADVSLNNRALKVGDKVRLTDARGKQISPTDSYHRIWKERVVGEVMEVRRTTVVVKFGESHTLWWMPHELERADDVNIAPVLLERYEARISELEAALSRIASTALVPLTGGSYEEEQDDNAG